jgi:hypothetical protein
MRAWTLVGLALSSLVGCDGCRPAPTPIEEEYVEEELAPLILEEREGASSEPPPPPMAEGAPPAPSPDTRDRRPPILPTSPDREHETTEPVRARRFVYRVRMIVPGGLGDADDRIARPSPELFVDVSHDRLRARFAGSGWPVPAGSEVRLRRDRPGAYLFDPQGGRPLAPGELAAWFEGGEVTRRGPPLRVIATLGPTRSAPPSHNDEEMPGQLVCAFLAEWSAEPRDVMRRCDGGAPALFRLGFWRAEQTAGVPVELPRTALRADEGDAPGYIPAQSSRALLEPAALGRIASSGPVPPELVQPDAPAEGLRVINESAARAIVTVQGVAIGWLDAGASALFVGLQSGSYEVGAIRPLGAVVQRGRPVPVPGTHRICDGRCRREPPTEATSPVGSGP